MPINSAPLVSIIVPVYNDQDYIARALDSCLAQTLRNIEVICIDDASTDNTVRVIKRYVGRDVRVKLIVQPKNLSALQARRVGIEAARSKYILFLDGDDELAPQLAELTYNEAIRKNADIVSFSPKLVFDDHRTAEYHQATLIPPSGDFFGTEIIANVFQPGTYVQSHLWRYLFDKSLLTKAYEGIPQDTIVRRANDVMISFVALAYAEHYVHIPDMLYFYHIDNGGSGHDNIDYEKFLYYIKAIDSTEMIPGLINKEKFTASDFKVIFECYESLRLRTIANTVNYGTKKIQTKFKGQAIARILERVPLEDIVLALGAFSPKVLPEFQKQIKIASSNSRSKKIIVFTSNLSTGGAQGVALSQAKFLADTGYEVMLLVRSSKKIAFDIPENITVRTITGGNTLSKLQDFLTILEDFKPSVFIDHYVLYNQTWPFYALLAKIHGAKTIGWMHNFSLRPAHDLSRMGVFLREHLWILDTVITLSKRDTAYWKISGFNNVYFLPNPPSPLLIDNPPANKVKKPPTTSINLLWYGRLQQSTKRIYSLVLVAKALRKITPDFHLTIIGPESDDMTYAKLQSRIKKHGLQENITVAGEKRGADLINEIRRAHVFLTTSSIEGYPLAITEAQSFGLPVVMYELPWIDFIENNAGIVGVKQNQSKEAANHIYTLLKDHKLYETMSKGSIAAAKEYLSYDFAKLYDQLVKGTLPAKYSPMPTLDDAKFFFEWYDFYTSSNATKFEKLSENSSDYRAAAMELKALKRSFAHRLGQRVAAPVRLIKIKLKPYVASRGKTG